MMSFLERLVPCAWAVLVLIGGCGKSRAVLNDGGGNEVEVDSLPVRVELPEIQLAVSGGQKDLVGKYQTAVIVLSDSVPDLSGETGSCSGVLIEPDLVLTAAHCMCMQAINSAKKDELVSKGNRATSAKVMGHIIKPKDPTGKKTKVKELAFPLLSGKVFLPDEFKIEFGGDGNMKQLLADFAVIRLEDKIDVPIDHKLADRESVAKDEVTVVGFGSVIVNGNDFPAIRHFGKNKITGDRWRGEKEDPLGTKEILEFYFHEEKGAHIEAGDSGGPCFREDKSGRWLVGINNGKRPKIGVGSAFLSTFHSRKLINSLIIRSRTGIN